MITRKKFIQSAFMGTAGLSITPGLLLAQDTKPQLPGELVKEFVGKSHSNKDRVIELHKEFPTLLNAAWDWGGGDFETGLGAASHVGLIDLVNYLVDNGAQMNFLTLCLLGKTDLVKAWVGQYPNLVHMIGPHGYTALHHAINGKENALEVKEFLESKGAKETLVKLKFPS